MHSRPDRLREIADRFNLDHTAMLDNILYARAYTSELVIWYIYMALNGYTLYIAGEHQMELLDSVAAKFYEEPGVFKLMVNGLPHVYM